MTHSDITTQHPIGPASGHTTGHTTGQPIGHMIGKYRVSPLTKGLDDGRWRASVSIRSGRGSATTDRVMRFDGSFATEAAAHSYAQQQGLAWVTQAHQHAAAPPPAPWRTACPPHAAGAA